MTKRKNKEENEKENLMVATEERVTPDRLRKGKSRGFFQIVRRHKLDIDFTPGALLKVVDYLKIGTRIGKENRYQLIRNDPVTAYIIKWKLTKKKKDSIYRKRKDWGGFARYTQEFPRLDYDIVEKLGNSKILEFRQVSHKPWRLSPMGAVLVSEKEKEVFILVSPEAPLQLTDDFIEEVRALFALWMFKIEI